MSNTVFIIQSDSQTIASIKAKLEENDIRISDGYGDMKATQLRIANFENNTLGEIEKLVAIVNNI